MIGGNVAKDSDAGVLGKSGQVTLAPVLNPTTAADSAKTFNFTLDAGIKKPVVPLGAIGDFVFLDNDGSNTQTAGDSPIVGEIGRAHV